MVDQEEEAQAASKHKKRMPLMGHPLRSVHMQYRMPAGSQAAACTGAYQTLRHQHPVDYVDHSV